LTFAPGTTTQTITVNIIGNVIYENNETLFVNLTNPTNATIGVGQGVGTILNDDPPPTVSINSVSQNEGNSGTTAFVFTVSLNLRSEITATVNYTTADGTAQASDGDYQATSGTLTFNPGVTSQTITVLVNGNTVPEFNETFFVNLSAPANATIGTAQGTGTIVDDDQVLITSDGFGYGAHAYPYQNLNLSTSDPSVFVIMNQADNKKVNLNIGASGVIFNFYTTDYSSIWINSNGMVTFDQGESTGANTNLLTQPSERAISPLWSDWISTANNPMVLGKYVDTNGDGIIDQFIIQWNQMDHVTSSPGAVTFQLILQVNTSGNPGDFYFNYVNLNTGDANANGATSTVGWKNNRAGNRGLVSFDTSSAFVGSGQAIKVSFTSALRDNDDAHKPYTVGAVSGVTPKDHGKKQPGHGSSGPGVVGTNPLAIEPSQVSASVATGDSTFNRVNLTIPEANGDGPTPAMVGSQSTETANQVSISIDAVSEFVGDVQTTMGSPDSALRESDKGNNASALGLALDVVGRPPSDQPMMETPVQSSMVPAPAGHNPWAMQAAADGLDANQVDWFFTVAGGNDHEVILERAAPAADDLDPDWLKSIF
jgi:hypothetical protein